MCHCVCVCERGKKRGGGGCGERCSDINRDTERQTHTLPIHNERGLVVFGTYKKKLI